MLQIVAWNTFDDVYWEQEFTIPWHTWKWKSPLVTEYNIIVFIEAHSFGKIILCFTLNNKALALIQHSTCVRPYSNFFKQSKYYDLIKRPMDWYYFVVKETNTFRVIDINEIITNVSSFKDSRDATRPLLVLYCVKVNIFSLFSPCIVKTASSRN